jgi:hypothetical protein
MNNKWIDIDNEIKIKLHLELTWLVNIQFRDFFITRARQNIKYSMFIFIKQ